MLGTFSFSNLLVSYCMTVFYGICPDFTQRKQTVFKGNKLSLITDE